MVYGEQNWRSSSFFSLHTQTSQGSFSLLTIPYPIWSKYKLQGQDFRQLNSSRVKNRKKVTKLQHDRTSPIRRVARGKTSDRLDRPRCVCRSTSVPRKVVWVVAADWDFEVCPGWASRDSGKPYSCSALHDAYPTLSELIEIPSGGGFGSYSASSSSLSHVYTSPYLPFLFHLLALPLPLSHLSSLSRSTLLFLLFLPLFYCF